tara:strand:+ start:2316 stop:2822 length:507 start_codon:yes stop_codon:yes gene_type:complete
MIRLSDIRETDVAEQAGMSNIPWEFEYGFQRCTDPCDDQVDVLDELYNYGASTEDEAVLDGLSPDRDGCFNTTITVKRDGRIICVKYPRETLIAMANKLLRKAVEEIALAVQREYVLEGPNVQVVYELCPELGTTKCIVIDGLPFPIYQILDLRGIQSIGRMDWVDAD